MAIASQSNNGGASNSGYVTDRSGTVTLGGTAQAISPENLGRKFLWLYNASVETLWVNFGVDAVADSPSIPIAAGATLVFEGSYIPATYISLLGAVTGSKFTYKEA